MQIKTLKGNAILTALFIMALVAITTAAIMRRVQNDILRTEQFVHSHELHYAAQLVPFWAMAILTKNKPLVSVPMQTGLIMNLPQNLQKLYIGVKVTGGLYDLQSKFNLNTLSDVKMQAIFMRLLQNLDPTINPNFIKTLINAIVQWITPSVDNNDKWSQYYKSLPNPYLPSHQPMRSVYELYLVAGMTPALFMKIYPFITALPDKTPINFNVASNELLAALSQTDNNSQLEQVIALRKQKGMLNAEEFKDAVASLKIDASTVTLDSKYFLAISVAEKGQSNIILYSIIERTPKKPKPSDQQNAEQDAAQNEQNLKNQVSLIKQSINTL